MTFSWMIDAFLAKLQKEPIIVSQARKTQIAWKDIQNLQKKSKFTRKIYFSPRYDEIKQDEDLYVIKFLTIDDIECVNQVQVLLEQTFKKEEVDPKEKLISNLKERKIKLYVVLQKERVVSILICGLVTLPNSNEVALMITYAVTTPKLRYGGLSREAYISALIDSSIEAQSLGKQLIAAGGECVSSSEDYWNGIGWKRVYLQKNPNIYEEVTYFQPALQFDPQTGNVAKDAGPVPEHFMVIGFKNKILGREELGKMVQAFYEWTNVYPRHFFKNELAYTTHVAHINERLSIFKNSLGRVGPICFFTKQERIAKKTLGSRFIEHPADQDMYPSATENF